MTSISAWVIVLNPSLFTGCFFKYLFFFYSYTLHSLLAWTVVMNSCSQQKGKSSSSIFLATWSQSISAPWLWDASQIRSLCPLLLPQLRYSCLGVCFNLTTSLTPARHSPTPLFISCSTPLNSSSPRQPGLAHGITWWWHHVSVTLSIYNTKHYQKGDALLRLQ